jgi:hypothetical protein
VSRFKDDIDFFAEPETVEVVQAGRRLSQLRRSDGRSSGEGPRLPTPSLVPRLVPLARLAGLIAILIVTVVGFASWINACQGSSRHAEYASYAIQVRALAESSQSVGGEFANTLLAPSLTPTKLEASLQTYAQQEQEAYDQAQQIRVPGPLRSIHQRLVDALDLRARGLADLGGALERMAGMKDESAAAQTLTNQAALLTTSDIVWEQLYRFPATAQSKALGVTGVVIPESRFVANRDLLSAASFVHLLQRLRGVSLAPTPVLSLKPGDSGVAVGVWQTQLNRWLKKAQPQQSQLPLTETFDSATEAATRQLQTAASISADGIVGPATRQALTRELARTGG